MIVNLGPAHSQSDRLAKMRGRLVPLVESLVGGADIVVAGCVVRIDRNGLGEISHRLGVARALLRHQAEKVHAGDMRRLAREDFLAELLSGRQVSEIEMTPRFGGQIVDLPQRSSNRQPLVALECCSPFRLAHEQSSPARMNLGGSVLGRFAPPAANGNIILQLQAAPAGAARLVPQRGRSDRPSEPKSPKLAQILSIPPNGPSFLFSIVNSY